MNEQIDFTPVETPEETEPLIAEQEENVTQPPKICSNCNHPLTNDQKFCPNCGTTVEEQKTLQNFCNACGTEIPAETKFCPNCGKQVFAPPSVPAVKKEFDRKKLFLIGGIVAAAIIIFTIILCIALRDIPVESIVLSETKIELKEKETKNVSCTVYPENASDKTVIWTSSDTSVATVNSYGMITAVGKGTCTITAKSGEKIETITITVKTKVDFEKLYDDFCSSTWATLGNDKSYLFIDSNPYDYDDGDYRYSSAVWDAVKKIHKALELPDSLWEDMLQTTWSMGKQSETFSNLGITVTWTYHPDKGLEVTYKLINN